MCFRFVKSQRFRWVAVFIKSKISSFKLFYFTFSYHTVNIFKSLPFKRYFESGNKNMYNHHVLLIKFANNSVFFPILTNRIFFFVSKILKKMLLQFSSFVNFSLYISRKRYLLHMQVHKPLFFDYYVICHEYSPHGIIISIR